MANTEEVIIVEDDEVIVVEDDEVIIAVQPIPGIVMAQPVEVVVVFPDPDFEQDFMNTHSGLHSREYCQAKIEESIRRQRRLEAQFKLNRQIIKDKVKGQIRDAQRRNKDIKEEISYEIAGRQCWYNGGVM